MWREVAQFSITHNDPDLAQQALATARVYDDLKAQAQLEPETGLAARVRRAIFAAFARTSK